jgi:hypothetical protein
MHLLARAKQLRAFVLFATLNTAWVGTALAGGSTPGGEGAPAYTATATDIYTANGAIEEWDSTTGTEINSMSAVDGNHATTTAFSPDGSTLYVASQTSDNSTITISSYDPSLNLINGSVATFTTSVDDDNNPGNVATLYVSGNTLYVANTAYYNTNLETVNLTTGVSSSLLTDNDSLEGIVVEGNTIYASSYGNGTVETFDATTGALTNGDFITLPIGSDGYNTGGYMTTSGNTLFVDDWDTLSVGAYNLTTGATINDNFIAELGGNPNVIPEGLTVSGDTLYVTGNDGNTYEYDSTTGQYLETMIAGLFSPDDITSEPESGFIDPSATPEPRSWMLGCLMLGLCGVLLRRRMATAQA